MQARDLEDRTWEVYRKGFHIHTEDFPRDWSPNQVRLHLIKDKDYPKDIMVFMKRS